VTDFGGDFVVDHEGAYSCLREHVGPASMQALKLKKKKRRSSFTPSPLWNVDYVIFDSISRSLELGDNRSLEFKGSDDW
jgi:hypothetical protein